MGFQASSAEPLLVEFRVSSSHSPQTAAVVLLCWVCLNLICLFGFTTFSCTLTFPFEWQTCSGVLISPRVSPMKSHLMHFCCWRSTHMAEPCYASSSRKVSNILLPRSALHGSISSIKHTKNSLNCNHPFYTLSCFCRIYSFHCHFWSFSNCWWG